MNILLVEDDPLVAFGLTTLLGDSGHEVRWAATGLEALEALAGFLPDVIITDRRMPSMDGLEFAKAVHTSGIAPRVPLVLLSGHTGDLSASEKAVFALVLAKPISDEELMARVHEVVGHPA